MDLLSTRRTLQRLIVEADTVAPSIAHFATDHNYSRVTDEHLDGARCLAFEVEAEAVLASLSQEAGPRFVSLHQRFQGQLKEKVHSRSIHVHKTQLVLRAALQLLQAEDSSAADTPQTRAMRLLGAIRSRTELGTEPVFATDLVAECRMTPAEAQAAWRYLRDHRLIETYQIDYAARINAAGIDKLTSLGSPAPVVTHTSSTARTEMSERGDLPALPKELLAVLRDVWSAAIASGGRVDAPVYRENHRGLAVALTELESRRCIARDGDHLRLTPLGVLLLTDDARASDTIRLGEQVRSILQRRFRDRATRTQPYLLDDLAREMRLPRAPIQFALFHLTDAVGRWCAQFTPDFAAPTAILIPADRVLEGHSIGDVARELASWAASTRPAEIAIREAHRNVAPVSTTAAQPDTLAERWIKRLKNNWLIAIVVVLGVGVIGAGSVIENTQKIFGLFKPAQTAAPTMDQELARDAAVPIDLCRYQRESGPVLECVPHNVCKGPGTEGLGFAIDKASKEAAVYSCKQSCKTEAARLHAQCATPPPY